jgi:hypothetical protein
LKVLAQREAAARAQRRSAVWGGGRPGGLGLALLRFALPPPPPPAFLALPPPRLWATALACLADLCCAPAAGSSDHRSALRGLSEEPHVSAAPLPHPAALAAAAAAAAADAAAADAASSNGFLLGPPSTPGGGWSRSSSSSSGSPDVTLSGLGCAVRWLLLGPTHVAAALAAAADATRNGGPRGARGRKRQLAHSPLAAAAAAAADDDDSTTGHSSSSSVRSGGGDTADAAAALHTRSDADAGCCEVLGGMLNLVARAAAAEGPGGCLMAVGPSRLPFPAGN